MIGAAIEEYYAKQAKERQRAAGGDHGNQYTGGEVALPQNFAERAKEEKKDNESTRKAAPGC
jgi:hypothetical protein